MTVAWRRILLKPAVVGCILIAVLLSGLASGSSSGIDSDAAFNRFAEAYVTEYLAAHPVRATKLGIHDHDTELPEMSRTRVHERVGRLNDWLSRLRQIEPTSLTENAAYDHEILDHAIRAELLELEEVREWERNPMRYNRILAESAALLVDREFAELDVRLDALIRRLELYPRIIAAAKRNLRNVPRLWADMAVQQTQGTVEFLEHSLPLALDTQGLSDLDPVLRARWARTHRRATRRVRNFGTWLEKSLQPRADGDFRLGSELFRKKLRLEEHVTLSLAELTDLNEAAIQDYRRRVEETARRIEPSTPAGQVMRRITTNHPSPETLIPTARRFVEQARDLVVTRNIVTLPTDRLPVVRPSPEYARNGFASMATPGPFETRKTSSYYNITNVDPSWSALQQSEHLTYFNYPGLLGISVHEVMPGHYVQLLYQQQLSSTVRKVFATASLIEGWAHYTEQMMVDEGLGDDAPEIRLGQLRRALQRHARWYAGVALHTGDATIKDTARRFEQIAYFAPFPALRETQRGTYNPTYLYYALGRMQILELREDYRRQLESRGETFSLRDFHDRFLRLGLPISLARKALLRPNDTTAQGSGSIPIPSASRL